ncbi:MAG: hypothetical protein ACRDKW_16325 [Actinomycetota bacterium]
MSPQLTPAQVAALDDIVATCGLKATLHALAGHCRRRARDLEEDLGERWEGFADRIDEYAESILDVVDGGASRWGTPLWRRRRGES